MNILMVSSEAMPFASTGGLASAVTFLASTLIDNGHNVKILLPRYYGISRDILTSTNLKLNVFCDFEDKSVNIYTSTIKTSQNNNLEFYFIDYEKYFGRDGIYGTKEEPNYNDNPQRFSLLCHSTFQLCRELNWFPDIIHSYDWPTALISVLLKFYERKNPEFSNTKSILTIHNLGFQGIYSKHLFPTTNIEWKYYYSAGFENFDNMNFLKAGIQCADMITTVSPTYAKEILTEKFGLKLDSLLRYRSEDLYGILNGIDSKFWNPQTDKFIFQNYSVDNLKLKTKNKLELQRRMGLEINPDIPLISFYSQFIEQKGINELFSPSFGCTHAICTDMKIQFVVMGTGESWCENEIKILENNLPNFKSFIGFDEELEHLLICGSDFMLIPSKYEPCGSIQMNCQRYGTLPIISAIGGLADSVENYNEKTGTGTGFMFNDLTPQSVYDTVGWAVFAWYNKSKHITQMQKRVMEKDFSWENSAHEYEKLYTKLLKK